MKTPLAASLSFLAFISAHTVSAQVPAAGANMEHRIAGVSQQPPAATQAASSLTYMYCESNVGSPPVYFSSIFTVSLPPQPEHRISPDREAAVHRAEAAFLAFLRQKYSYTTNANYATGCPFFAGVSDPLSLAQMSKKGLEAQVRASNFPAIETGWTYDPSAPIAAAPAPAAPPPPPLPAMAAHPAASSAPAHAASAPVAPAGKAYRCMFDFHQGTQGVRYSAGPIVTEAAPADLKTAFEAFVRATYHLGDGGKGHAACPLLQGLPANRERAVSAWEANSNQIGVKTLHVNWPSPPRQ